MYIAIPGYKAQLRPSSYVIHVIFQLVIFRQTKQVTILHIYQVAHFSKADIHFCQKFDNFLFSCFEIVLNTQQLVKGTQALSRIEYVLRVSVKRPCNT